MPKNHEYFKERSTWLGIGAGVIVLINIFAPEYTSYALAVLTAMGLIAEDHQKPTQ